jgi:activator of 2-hydroxyglutaryl-CoA dehydratase
MAGNDIASPVVFTGGVAMISGMQQALENLLAQSVTICPKPQLTGALGASILASKQINDNHQEN